jgi:hypothetical protein
MRNEGMTLKIFTAENTEDREIKLDAFAKSFSVLSVAPPHAVAGFDFVPSSVVNHTSLVQKVQT